MIHAIEAMTKDELKARLNLNKRAKEVYQDMIENDERTFFYTDPKDELDRVNQNINEIKDRLDNF